ncbi:MAG TPA: RES family NAD+ phosphorylase [Oligoflexus sp.]|uniref:RES family NAD+ phosphorylase n=1 Tax=Oligoflexus sp. TaxID=1971216 RepID=UPI002D37A99D|nr:RES family NAD+ phosphorylase [Oligoflexus sp.]HYX37593.1 RES family NAD+ phosphorylase [Oligoflexus sp.]
MIGLIPELKLQSHGTFEAFRNIATCSPSQNLFDDLVDEEDWTVLQYADNLSSGIDHSLPQRQRFEQYAKIDDSMLCFDEQFWRWGRFGRKNYGVWYGALEEETSVRETLYHRPEIDINDLNNAHSPIIQARCMFKADLAAQHYADLRPYVASFPSLVHPRDYSLCQNLGQHAVEQGIDLYLTPSARWPGGTCTPVFSARSIVKDQSIRTYFFHFPLDQSEPFYSTMQQNGPIN